MADPKVSMTWWSFANRGVDDADLIRATAETGYDGIELADPALWPRIADAGLAIASHGGHDSIEVGLNRPDQHDRIEREVTERLALAQRWGIPTLICFSGNRDGLADEAGAAATVAGLQRVAKAAEDAGVTLALELLNSRVDHPGYQCDRSAWGVGVVEGVGSPRVRLLYDVYHMQIMEGDVIRTIGEHSRWFGHYHVAGNPGRHEPDATQELNYPPIYRAIRETGFDGWLGMEYVPTGDPVASLRHALAGVWGS